MTLAGLSSSQLVKMRDYLDEMSGYISHALTVQKSYLETVSPNDAERQEVYAHSSPDAYYHLRLAGKSCAIVCDRWIVSSDGTHVKSSDIQYHIAFYGYRPKYVLSNFYKLPTDYIRCFYGNFDSFDVAKKEFYKACLDLIFQVCPVLRPLQSDLFSEMEIY